MRARRIFDFGEKCALVAAPNLDQVAAWPPSEFWLGGAGLPTPLEGLL